MNIPTINAFLSLSFQACPLITVIVPAQTGLHPLESKRTTVLKLQEKEVREWRDGLL